MINHFESPGILLERANERTRDLKERIKDFIDKKPYAHVVEPDPDGVLAYKFKIIGMVPHKARADAFEITNSLRSALDHAVFGAAVALNGGRPKRTKFPFGDTATGLDDDIKRRCQDVPPEIIALLRAFKPYQGGNDPLWALNKMRNTKIHQILLPMAFATTGTSIQIGSIKMTGSGPAQIGMNRWDPVKQEVTYMRIAPPPVQGDYYAQATIAVVIGDVPVLGGKPALTVFDNLCREIASIIGAIEAETIRLLKPPNP